MPDPAGLADCKERVALELAYRIANYEEVDQKAPRRYWLELYAQCMQVINSDGLPDEIQERPAKPEEF